MTPIFHQVDPDVFPNPHAFLPERWIDLEEQQRIRMERHFVPYSKGTRQCAGIKSVVPSTRSQVSPHRLCQILFLALANPPSKFPPLTPHTQCVKLTSSSTPVSQTQNSTCASPPSLPASTLSSSRPTSGTSTWPSTHTTIPRASTARAYASSRKRRRFRGMQKVLTASDGAIALRGEILGT